jgi:hypothetical protein
MPAFSPSQRVVCNAACDIPADEPRSPEGKYRPLLQSGVVPVKAENWPLSALKEYKEPGAC